MDDGSADIMSGIKALREKAETQLTGNDYYMITQQLDALAASGALDPVARSLLSAIESRLNGDSAGEAATAAIMDASPIAPAAEAPVEGIVVSSPAAGSFSGGAHATASGGFTAVEVEPEAASVEATSAPVTSETPTGLRAAVDAVRGLIQERLDGNPFYVAANLLDQLRAFPPAPGGREIVAAPESFDEALALLRSEIGWLSGFTQVEASRMINALARIVAPPAEPEPEPAAAPEPHAVAAAAPTAEPQPQPAVAAAPTAESQPEPVAAAAPAAEPVEAPAPSDFDLADAPDPEPETGPRVGFDDLADAAWQRVKAAAQADRIVVQADRGPAPSLNGSSAPAASAMPKAELAPAEAEVHIAPMAQPEPAEAEAHAEPVEAEPHVEPMAQDMSEALKDGGSERRSSEPCHAAEFELETGAAPHAGDEPAGQTVADQEIETAGEAAASAEAEVLTELAEPEQAMAATVPEIVIAEATEAIPEAITKEQAEELPVIIELSPATAAAPEAKSAEPVLEESVPVAPSLPPVNRGLFGRLFGSRPAGHP